MAWAAPEGADPLGRLPLLQHRAGRLDSASLCLLQRLHDITSIFCSACDCLGLRWTASFPKKESAAVSIYVSRKADVAKLDEFIGPKR